MVYILPTTIPYAYLTEQFSISDESVFKYVSQGFINSLRSSDAYMRR